MAGNKKVYKTGLLGWPVKHSISPAMHNAGFKALGLEGRYALYPTAPETLEDTVQHLLDTGIDGLNVTIPHKQAVLDLPQVVETSNEAKNIGAANTLTRLPNGQLRASNTDIHGVREDLLIHNITLNKTTRCLILGTGGSAKALAEALRYEDVTEIWYTSRQGQEKNRQLRYAELAKRVAEIKPTLIVNCTPVGMWPNIDASPWPENLHFPQGATLYDLIYRPEETQLMQQAKATGCQSVGGLGMLVRQAALSFGVWTGQRPNYDVMYNAAKEALKNG